MILTPGYNFTDTEAVTAAKLNQLGAPTATREQADLDAGVDAVQTQLGSGVAKPNYFRNAGLDLWTRGTTAVTCAVGVRQLRADDWWVRCNATSANLPGYQRVSNSAQKFLAAAQVIGEAGVGSVDFGQDLTARIAALFAPKITVSFTVANGTSAALTPVVMLDTCDAFEIYTAATNRAAVAVASAIASGATTACTVTLDLTAFAAALRNGAQLYLRFPAGALDSAIKTVSISALKVEDGAIPSAIVPERELANPAAVAVLERHYLANGALDRDRWLSTSLVSGQVAAGLDNYGPLGWFTNPSNGSTMTVARDAAVPNAATFYSAKLTGSAATTGTVDFGQNIESTNAARLARSCVFSAYVYNGTGAAINPQARLDTFTTIDRPDTASNQQSQTLPSCPDGQWTRVSFAFDGSTISNLANGARIYLRFLAGMLNTTSKHVKIAQCELELGVVVSAFDPPPLFEQGDRRAMVPLDLGIVAASTTTLTVTTAAAVLAEISGLLRTATAISTGIDTTTVGAGGLDTGTIAVDTAYYVWLIGTRTAVAAMLSLSDSAPALPAGYTYRLLLGWLWNATTTGVSGNQQRGRCVRYAPRQLFATKTVTAFATWQTLRSLAAAAVGYLAPFAPLWACRLHGVASTGAASYMAFAAGVDSAGLVGIGESTTPLSSATGGLTANPTRPAAQGRAIIELAPGQAALDAYVRGTNATNFSLDLTGFDF